MGIKSRDVKVWTKELMQIDPTTYKPDLILELDDENLIVEFQSIKVGGMTFQEERIPMLQSQTSIMTTAKMLICRF